MRELQEDILLDLWEKSEDDKEEFEDSDLEEVFLDSANNSGEGEE